MSQLVDATVRPRWKSLEKSIQGYLAGQVTFSVVESALADWGEQGGLPAWYNDLYHALQHYEIDYAGLDDLEKRNMSRRVEAIVSAISSGDVSLLSIATDKFFNDPYGIG